MVDDASRNDQALNHETWRHNRRTMVETQIRARGVDDPRVLDAMLNVPRERFLAGGNRQAAYEDRPLAIGHGQTISQPYIVAYMTQKLALAPACRVLEVGTGTGYQTAVLALLCAHVYTIERIGSLQQRAAEILDDIGISNISMVLGDGSMGLEDQAPFDRILVTAASPRVPQALVEQLVDSGRLVAPVGGKREQTIVTVVRRGVRTIETPDLPCHFVKLIGEQGWAAD